MKACDDSGSKSQVAKVSIHLTSSQLFFDDLVLNSSNLQVFRSNYINETNLSNWFSHLEELTLIAQPLIGWSGIILLGLESSHVGEKVICFCIRIGFVSILKVIFYLACSSINKMINTVINRINKDWELFETRALALVCLPSLLFSFIVLHHTRSVTWINWKISNQ